MTPVGRYPRLVPGYVQQMKKLSSFLIVAALAAAVAFALKSRRPEKVVEDMATIDLDHPERTIDQVNAAMPIAGGIRP
ncbi:MAG TPA: hypothetical protein VFP54_05335 [Acidimicrobiales bacterium]|nr:hypothetical protein [Acidimicrobiales bacterium]